MCLFYSLADFVAKLGCLEHPLLYDTLQPWVLTAFCISTISIEFPFGLSNWATKFVYKYVNFVCD